jgi:DNA-binding LytR/AlgR family response regulator
MRVVIADDEPIALERLRLGLACVPDAELVGAAKTGREAAALIRELKPDVAVLDIQMPGQNGLGVVAGLRGGDFIPEVIFVTAFDQHAVSAFEVQAVDYLLKPVPFDRLRQALRRAKARLEARAADARFSELQSLLTALSTAEQAVGRPAYERELWVRERQGLTRLPLECVHLLEAEGDYVVAHTPETTHLLKDTISSLQGRLDPAAFLRVHRSAIVNMARIRTLKRRGKRGYCIALQSGPEVPVGPSYVDSVLATVNARRWR